MTLEPSDDDKTKREEKQPESRQQSILFGAQRGEVHSRKKGKKRSVLQQDGCEVLPVDVEQEWML
jgi:hypothetical protein